MLIDILTLFPSMFSGPFEESIIKRAQERGLVEIKIHNLRDWTKDKHKTVDDRPFGGGPGMVLMCQPIFDAVEGLLRRKSHPERPRAAVEGESRDPAKRWMRRLRRLDSSALPRNDRIGKTSIALLTPQGQVFNQETARRLSKLDHLILICGHYEGVDERVREHLVDEEISIGDYVLTGGELPSMVVVDAIVRLIPGVLEKPEAIESESFSRPGLEFPQYTRPENFRGLKVPEILLSGNHQEIEKWRKEQALKRTKTRRPDLFRRKMK